MFIQSNDSQLISNNVQDDGVIALKDEKIKNLEAQLLKLSNEKSNMLSSFQLEKSNLEMRLKDLELKFQTEMLKKNHTDSNDNQFKYLLDQEKETTRQLREALNIEKQKLKEITFEYEQRIINSNKEQLKIENEKKEYVRMYEELLNKHKHLEVQYSELNSRYAQKDKELHEAKTKLEKVIEEQSKTHSQTLANLNALELMKQQLLREKADLSRKLSLTSSDSEKRSASLLYDFKTVEQKYNEQVQQIERLQKEKMMLLQSLKNEIERNSILTCKLEKLKLHNKDENINKTLELDEKEEKVVITDDNEREGYNLVNHDEILPSDTMIEYNPNESLNKEEEKKDNIEEYQDENYIENKEANDNNVISQSSDDKESISKSDDDDNYNSLSTNQLSFSTLNESTSHRNDEIIIKQHENIFDSELKNNINSDNHTISIDTPTENSNNWISSLPLVGKLMGRKTPQQSPNQPLKQKATNY